MKHIICIILLSNVLIGYKSFAQDKPVVDGPQITWEKASVDFGDLKQGDRVEHTFKFANTGNQPLVITNVEVTCGCTTPKGWPRDPIGPGDKAEIIVAFNSAAKFGRQHKVVKVVSNAINTPNQVMFTANVLPKE